MGFEAPTTSEKDLLIAESSRVLMVLSLTSNFDTPAASASFSFDFFFLFLQRADVLVVWQ